VNNKPTLELQKPPAETQGVVAVGLHPVVRRHPWRTGWVDWEKVRKDKREASLRRRRQQRQDSLEYFRMTERVWHKKNPDGAHTGNPRFHERAVKANAAKKQMRAEQLIEQTKLCLTPT
jgi:hypothetical protein